MENRQTAKQSPIQGGSTADIAVNLFVASKQARAVNKTSLGSIGSAILNWIKEAVSPLRKHKLIAQCIAVDYRLGREKANLSSLYFSDPAKISIQEGLTKLQAINTPEAKQAYNMFADHYAAINKKAETLDLNIDALTERYYSLAQETDTKLKEIIENILSDPRKPLQNLQTEDTKIRSFQQERLSLEREKAEIKAARNTIQSYLHKKFPADVPEPVDHVIRPELSI